MIIAYENGETLDLCTKEEVAIRFFTSDLCQIFFSKLSDLESIDFLNEYPFAVCKDAVSNLYTVDIDSEYKIYFVQNIRTDFCDYISPDCINRIKILKIAKDG